MIKILEKFLAKPRKYSRMCIWQKIWMLLAFKEFYMKTLILKRTKKFFIIPTSPFNFDGTFHKPSHFPNKLKLDDWKPKEYCQTLRIDRDLFAIAIKDKGTLLKQKLEVTVYSITNLDARYFKKIKQEIIYRFGLNFDLREFNRLIKSDKRFYPIFKKWVGMRNSSQYTLYELLIIAIVLQNATIRRSQQMIDSLLAKFGIKAEFDNKELWAIWLPKELENVSEEELRALKVGYRAKFIKKLSKDFADGKVDEFKLRDFNKENAKEELMKLNGVGPETARILLFEEYHHYDVFEHIAPWQQKIYSRLFYGKKLVPTNKIYNDIKKQYGKYSMLAVHYIWEDIFWKRTNKNIPWLEKEIRL